MVKEAVAQNKAALAHYIWTEQPPTSALNGEVKKTTNYQCMYGPDGSVQKTATGGTPPPAPKRGLRGRIVENKTEDLTDYMQRAATLVKQYVPPNPEQMQAAFEQGNATIGADGPEVLQLQFTNYVKPGDSMVFYFNKQAKALTQVTVNSYMDDVKDAVSLQVNFPENSGRPQLRRPDDSERTSQEDHGSDHKHELSEDGAIATARLRREHNGFIPIAERFGEGVVFQLKMPVSGYAATFKDGRECQTRSAI